MANSWSRWVQAPQSVRLRKAVFQVHLWTGIGLGAYVFVICLTGSVLVYRNELYIAFSPQPVVVDGAGASLGEDALERAARQAWPGHEVQEVRPGETPNHAVRITLSRDGDRIRRLFDPFTGEDLGDPLPLGYRNHGLDAGPARQPPGRHDRPAGQRRRGGVSCSCCR